MIGCAPPTQLRYDVVVIDTERFRLGNGVMNLGLQVGLREVSPDVLTRPGLEERFLLPASVDY